MMKKENIFTISNGLSLLRLFITIPFWFLFDYYDTEWGRITLIILAFFGAFTDWADGFAARKMNQVTEFGKIIDPLADKICIGGIIIKMYLIGLINPFLFFLIIGRDLLIFIAGLVLAKLINKILPSNMLGKITVTSIGVYIIIKLFGFPDTSFFTLVIYYLTIILIFMSLLAYAFRAVEFIRLKSNETI